jgi:pyruvate formate lyase activating enzyme
LPAHNEPLITSEWAVEVFREARRRGLKTAYISNGNGTPEVIDYLRPWVDLYKVDLKSFRDRNYRKLGGRLDGVLDAIQRLYQGFWLEVVTLIIPGFSSGGGLAASLVSRRHFARYPLARDGYKDYRMTDPDNTSMRLYYCWRNR